MSDIALEADYHTHTIYSHGRGTIEDNVRVAIRRGLKRLAVTDHGFAQPLMGLTGEKFLQMRAIVDGLNRKYQGQIEVLLGVEANVVSMDGRIDVPDRYLDKLDILNLGLHRMVLSTSSSYLRRVEWGTSLSKIVRRLRHSVAQAGTEALCNALQRYPIDILTHPGYHFPVIMETLARAAVETGAVIEINSSHKLPTVDNLRVALDQGAWFAIGSDAHKPARVGDFAAGLALAAQAGVPAGRVINAAGSGFVLKRRR